jgi:hypothetical protein
MIYEPLDQSEDCLRVLTILPGEDLLWCQLRRRTFRSKPDYDCLSYTWGSGPASREITLNGEPFLIRTNLHDALWRLRLKDKPRNLWVDAICINQEDVMERNYQVSLMAFIYPRAKEVIVWLGDTSLPLFHGGFDASDWGNSPQSFEVARHPYWTRMWVVQELVLAQNIVIWYGWGQYTWEELKSKIIGDAAKELEKKAEPIMRQRGLRHTNMNRMEKLLETFQEAQCTEPRDKIFGLLGMAHDCDSDVLPVDYEEPYFHLYSRMINLHKSMPLTWDLVAESPFREIERQVMLVRFSQLVQRTLGGLVKEDVRAAKTPVQPDSRQWHVARGAVAGEILYLGPTHTETVSSLRARKVWKRAYEEHYEDSRRSIERLRAEDESYSQAILDWDEKRLSTIRAVHTNTSYGYRLHGDDESVEIDEETLSKPDGPEPRRFLATNVLLGFAPPEARVGDLVCRFWECDVAVIVRRIGDELTDRWMIVGKADISTSVKRSEDAQDALSLRYTMPEFYKWKGETELDKLRGALVRPDFKNMINFRLDTDTLQKLTC